MHTAFGILLKTSLDLFMFRVMTAPERAISRSVPQSNLPSDAGDSLFFCSPGRKSPFGAAMGPLRLKRSVNPIVADADGKKTSQKLYSATDHNSALLFKPRPADLYEMEFPAFP